MDLDLTNVIVIVVVIAVIVAIFRRLGPVLKILVVIAALCVIFGVSVDFATFLSAIGNGLTSFFGTFS